MTRDDIIKLAREAGLAGVESINGLAAFVLRFAALVSAAEREACVTACFQQTSRWTDDRARYAASECAAAIRARGLQ
ncbi:MAG: hypothetical protein ACRCTG_16775 [Aestuariivirga sp.]